MGKLTCLYEFRLDVVTNEKKSMAVAKMRSTMMVMMTQ